MIDLSFNLIFAVLEFGSRMVEVLLWTLFSFVQYISSEAWVHKLHLQNGSGNDSKIV